jgi:meiotically up-regulated gene 157 (Mug157) protein
MWLRDSTNQVWPYLPFAAEDQQLRDMLLGLLNRYEVSR